MSKLERFLADFPDNATSWAQATDELPDMYVWLSKELGLLPVGRDNCKSPAEWNQKYKAAIRKAAALLDPAQTQRFEERFGEWW